MKKETSVFDFSHNYEPVDILAKIKAKNQGLIKSATELLEEIIGNGFYVSLEVKEFVKKASGEWGLVQLNHDVTSTGKRGRQNMPGVGWWLQGNLQL